MSDPGALCKRPFVVVSPRGVVYIGLHMNEEEVWTVYLGWPSSDEIASFKNDGWYVAAGTITWTR